MMGEPMKPYRLPPERLETCLQKGYGNDLRFHIAAIEAEKAQLSKLLVKSTETLKACMDTMRELTAEVGSLMASHDREAGLWDEQHAAQHRMIVKLQEELAEAKEQARLSHAVKQGETIAELRAELAEAREIERSGVHARVSLRDQVEKAKAWLLASYDYQPAIHSDGKIKRLRDEFAASLEERCE